MTPEQEIPIALLNELEQYRRLLNNIPAEIGVLDLAGRYLFNTPSGIHDLAVRQWILGKTNHDYCRERSYPMSIADKRQAVIDQCIREKQSVSFEEVWIDKSGRRRYYVRTFGPILDADENVTQVLAYGQEITELKKAEDKLRKTHDALEEEVGVRRRAEKELRRALAEVRELKNRLQAENLYLREEIGTGHRFGEIIGEAAAMKDLKEAIETVAPTGANVLVTGETGTGKELVARALHNLSRRKRKTLIKVNCASIPKELFESEFFGHVRGAFTGAIRDRVGRFQLADRGTLFLDEVGEIPLEMQSKLLRVLQEGQFERVGSEKTHQVDVRIIAASNRNLDKEIEAGRFRQDLYYRLNVFPIEVAPLRDRMDDIQALAKHFLELACKEFNVHRRRLTQAGVVDLQGYDWPGNVRELRNVIERSVITSKSTVLRFDLPANEPGQGSATATGPVPYRELRRRERDNLLAALEATAWKIHGPGGAAELLQVKPTTLASRVKKMGLEKPKS